MDHDELCERLPDFYICHCQKRSRIARGLTELPHIEIQYPICLGCDKETYHDGDALRCDNCHAIWGTNPGDGDQAASFWDDYDSATETLDEMRTKWLNRPARKSVDSEPGGE